MDKFMGKISLQVASIVVFFTLSILCQAANHALLIGISDYPGKSSDLEGPVNDVFSMQEVLQQKWNVQPAHLNTLLNEQATRENILQALNDLYRRTTKDDYIFVYFSGHGTSAMDLKNNLPLPHQTGAFIPHGVPQVIVYPKAYVQQLIVGRRDLRPIFNKFDTRGNQVLVVMDACFSGQAVRGLPSLPKRYLPSKSVDDPMLALGDDFDADAAFDENALVEEPYPYRNVFFLGASGENETAADIPLKLVDFYPTIDGKAHGAFTDKLLRVLHGRLHADNNQDSQLAYAEIHQSVRSAMEVANIPHTPTRLPVLQEDASGLGQRALFDTKLSIAPPGSISFTVDARELNNDVQSSLNRLGIIQKDLGAHLKLIKAGEDVQLANSTNDQIKFLQKPTTDQIVRAVTTQKRIHDWMYYPTVSHFNLYGSLTSNRNQIVVSKGSVYRFGEELGFSLKADEDAFLIIMHVDVDGLISMIYPYQKSEVIKQTKNSLVDLPSIARVQAPEGRDYIQFIALKNWPKQLNSIIGKSFRINSNDAQTLYSILSDASIEKAVTRTLFYTKS